MTFLKINHCILFFFISTTQHSVDVQIKLVDLASFFFYSINVKRLAWLHQVSPKSILPFSLLPPAPWERIHWPVTYFHSFVQTYLKVLIPRYSSEVSVCTYFPTKSQTRSGGQSFTYYGITTPSSFIAWDIIDIQYMLQVRAIEYLN